MHHDPNGLHYSGLLAGDGWTMTPAEVRPRALWTSVTHWTVASAWASLSVTKDNWSTLLHLEWSLSEQCQMLCNLPSQLHKTKHSFSILRIHEHSLLPPTQRSSSYLHAVGFTLSTPFNGRTLYHSLSLFSSPLSLPSFFHLYSLHDDTPAMLSWQQSGPDCLVARQLTSPIRGTWRYKARDKQITQNMCFCTSLCWVLEQFFVWTLTVYLAHLRFIIFSRLKAVGCIIRVTKHVIQMWPVLLGSLVFATAG